MQTQIHSQDAKISQNLIYYYYNYLIQMLIKIRPKYKNTTSQTFQNSINVSKSQICPQPDDIIQDFNELGLNVYHPSNNIKNQQNQIDEQMIIVENSQKKQIIVNLNKKTIKKVKRYIETPQIVLERIKNTQIDLNPTCRICLEQDSLDKLISPCNCDGTIKYIHMDCLKTWLLKIEFQAQCELCNSFLQCQLTFSNKYVCSRLRQMSISQKLFFFIFPMLTLILFALGIYFITQIIKKSKDQYAYIFGVFVCIPAFCMLTYLFITMLIDAIRVKFVKTWTILSQDTRNDTDVSLKPLKGRARSQSLPQIYPEKTVQEQHFGKTIFKYITRQQMI
ncbi:unnamed protein product [Paramecium pentaurelia]|uniref:RING-CH-type domain-containing protein n=1 Tax=Paramecium pentaurelia TaxID=43138 RepID=A0A8S1SKS4_9CILI|nr:unnamed protein product [Paramecium pentaurelia]